MDLQRHHCRKVRESTREWRRRRTRTVLVLLRWPQEEKVEEKPCLARGLASLALGIAYPGRFKKRGGEGTSERTQSTRRNMTRKSLVLLLFPTGSKGRRHHPPCRVLPLMSLILALLPCLKGRRRRILVLLHPSRASGGGGISHMILSIRPCVDAATYPCGPGSHVSKWPCDSLATWPCGRSVTWPHRQRHTQTHTSNGHGAGRRDSRRD